MCYEWLNWIELRNRLNEFEMFIRVYNDEDNIWNSVKQCQEKHVERDKVRARDHNLGIPLLL